MNKVQFSNGVLVNSENFSHRVSPKPVASFSSKPAAPEGVKSQKTEPANAPARVESTKHVPKHPSKIAPPASEPVPPAPEPVADKKPDHPNVRVDPFSHPIR